jgi:hypothetical protein
LWGEDLQRWRGKAFIKGWWSNVLRGLGGVEREDKLKKIS